MEIVLLGKKIMNFNFDSVIYLLFQLNISRVGITY
jgi:hypothetical protein